MSNATVRVQFGVGALESDHLSVDIDDRATGPNEGKVSFMPGETAWFLVYRTPGLALKLESSAGSITGGQEVTLMKTEDVTFEDSSSGSLSVPATAITDVLWIGRSLGSMKLGPDGKSITTAASGVAIARVTYIAPAVSYALTAPASLAGLNDFDVLVLVTGLRPNDGGL